MPYMDKVMEITNRLEALKGISHILVQHDADCPAIDGGGYCTCDPDVNLVEPETLNRHQRRAAARLKG